MYFRLITIVLFLAVTTPSLAQKNRKQLTERINNLKDEYRKDKIDAETMWKRLSALQKKTQKKFGKHPMIFQLKSFLMQEENFYSLSLIFAREAITSSKNPFGDNLKASWHLMYDALKQGDVHDLLFQLAARLKKSPKNPPVMGRNWHFFRGRVYAEEKKYKEAIAAYKKVQSNDFIYLAARYEMAMTLIAWDKMEEAYRVLKTIQVAIRAKVQPHFDQENRMEIGQLARLAMARIDYERKRYASAVKHYRRVDRNSKRFYVALSEQSWPLFMAGFPNHALGTIYSAESPFFEDRFNPELPLLKSIIYFWMCRYQDSRVSLINFIDNYAKPVKELEGFLSRKNLSGRTAYQLFENMLAGVSSDSLGIERELLSSVAKSEVMMMHRARLAKAFEEKERLEIKGIWRPGFAPKQLMKIATRRVNTLKRKLGQAYIQELEAMREEYQRLRNQLDFLYVELLLSEKENLFGREMHDSAKMKEVSKNQKVKGWGKRAQSWASDDKDEFWFDEIGFYIFDLESQCN